MQAKVWDFWAARYERLWVQKYSLTPTRQRIMRELSGIMEDGREYRLLDMGCGTGQLIGDISKAFPGVKVSCVGADISPKMIEIAGANNSGAGFIVSSIDNLAGHEEFDIVVCTHSFPYYPNQEQALGKISALLKPGGHLLLAQASVNTLYDAVAMFFVKLTTGKANYPSIAAVKQMASRYFSHIDSRVIRERWYMPTIALFACRKGSRA